MAGEHPNLALPAKLDVRHLGVSASLFSDDIVRHCFDPRSVRACRPILHPDTPGIDIDRESHRLACRLHVIERA